LLSISSEMKTFATQRMKVRAIIAEPALHVVKRFPPQPAK
jgi:hypothetical protein